MLGACTVVPFTKIFLCSGFFSETIDKVPELEDLQFEARSSKDSAW
jgi:hypothetical protein